MIRTLTAAEAATLAGTTVTAVRALCRSGSVAAAKVRGRWSVSVTSLLHRLNQPLRRPADRLRRGEAAPVRTGRAARLRVGHHMSVARRYAVLDALCTRVNAGRATAAAYLAHLGADAEFVRRYGSVFGKHAAAAFRARTDAEPVRDCLARVGRRLVACFSYEACDLATAARSYGRTAVLLAA